MQVNKILERLIELTKLAVEESAEVTLFYLPVPSYTGYIIALAKIEATNKNNTFLATGTLFKAIEVGTKVNSLFVPLRVVKELKDNEHNTTSSIIFERTMNVVEAAVNTRGFMAGVDFRASIELTNEELETNIIKEALFNITEGEEQC